MRLTDIIQVLEPRREGETAGVTIDVMTGVVAGIALVIAILILAASLKPAQAAEMPRSLPPIVDAR